MNDVAADLTIREADWRNAADRTMLCAIRKCVFIDEQHVPVAMEWDEFDAASRHFLALIAGEAVGTARLKPDGQLGRMAVIASARCAGIGSRLLLEVLQAARNAGYNHLFCHAQISAMNFYARHGFNVAGDTFMDAGILHRSMQIDLQSTSNIAITSPAVTNQSGHDKTTLQLTSVNDNCDCVLVLAQQARHHLYIFSQELDAALYDNALFERAVFDLSRLHPSTHIRILVQDTHRAVQQGHRIVRLAQTLTSKLQIRTPSRDYRDEQSAFLLADNVGYYHRVVGNQYNFTAHASFMAPQQNRNLCDLFNKIWEHATEDPQLRRLHM